MAGRFLRVAIAAISLICSSTANAATSFTTQEVRQSCDMLFNPMCILSGEWLDLGGSLPFGSGVSPVKLTLDITGNLILYRTGTVVWQSGTANRGVVKAVMRPDGNLVLLRSDNSVAWATNTGGRKGAYLRVESHGTPFSTDHVGRAAIYAAVAKWSTNTAQSSWVSSTTGAALLGTGATIQTGQSRISGNGRVRLTLQGDGNLVLDDATNGVVKWRSNTAGRGVIKAMMREDGNFVLLNSLNAVIWQTGTSGNFGAKLAVQDDGNLVVYATQRIWTTNNQNSYPPPPSDPWIIKLPSLCFGGGFSVGWCP